jgi:two-component system CheB/CheR fusion protein
MKRKPAKIAKKLSSPAKKKSAKISQAKAPDKKTFPVVAIGASAGGLEASSQFLSNLAPDLGMAYVFIHHLSPNYDSQLAGILQRKTKMPVQKVGDKMKVQPDHVYVIPPNTFIGLADGHLTTRPRGRSEMHAIDYFFTELASTCQHNAIGVLLSGTDSDGTLGLKAIKLEGGITFAQDETATHTQMPFTATDAGYVDYVLPPYRIAEELGALIRHPFAVAAPNDELAQNEKEIKKILSIVLQKYDVDFFSHYKRTTVYRRIMRRMALTRIEKFEDYSKKLRQDNAEVAALYNDFLINVTSFFREPAFYESLEKIVFPKLIKDRKSGDGLRIWIAGCATGEEAYSTAICATEFLQSKKIAAPIQIFSTDLDEKAIDRARLGVYSKSSVQHISPQRLRTFFTKIDGHYQVQKSIRDMCIFSVHNLMKDPPFSRMDLISCQNVLIYIEAAPQRKILQAFHYALKPNGFFLLGKSESIGSAVELFQPLGKDSRLYIRKTQTAFSRLDFAMRHHPTSPPLMIDQGEARTENDIEKESDKLLLSRYVPASVLVNKDLEILRFRGATAPFFEPASGKASLNLMKMLKQELLFELRSLLQKAKKSESHVSKNDIQLDSRAGTISIEIAPLRNLKEIYFLIIFKENGTGTENIKAKKTKVLKGDQQARLNRLELALKDAREHIRAITEDFDVSREELQSANEEILSSNEELQSINEELETSKEELQSANEELSTINEELQNRIEELKVSRDYAEAIIGTIHNPLLVLNAQMRIRTANKAFYEFFKLVPEQTEGKFLYDLHQGQWDIPALQDQVRAIFPTRLAFKDFEINHNFPVIGNRTMVVNAQRLAHGKDDQETLILLAFEDITKYRSAQHLLLEAQEQLKLTLEGGSVGTWVWNIQTNEISGSREEANLFGLNEGLFFKTFAEWEKALHPHDAEDVKNTISRVISEKLPLDIEFRIIRKDGNIRWILSKANTHYNAKGIPEKMMGINIDITERKSAVEALTESENRFHTLSDSAPVIIWMTDENRQSTFVNKTWHLFTGKNLQDAKDWFSAIHPDDRAAFMDVYASSFASHSDFKVDFRLKRFDGEYRWMMAYGIPRYTNEDTFVGFIGTCIDVTERVDLEKQKDDFMGIASHELKTPVTSIKAYAQILQDKFRKANDTGAVAMLGRLDGQIDKLTSLINTLLDVARIQSGQMDYDEELIDVRQLIAEVTDEMQTTSSKHKIDVDIQADGKIFVDRARITQVLNNFISNAIKYSPDADKILVQTKKDDGQIIFSVTDYGIGIPLDLQEKIFGRFFRVSVTEGNRVSGLGLGLYICSQIVVQQNGRIWLESTPGKGSSFSFSLPLKEVAH